MKNGQMFWGFFLVTLGALFLLVKYDFVTGSFSFVWDLWPLIFVFWGALVIFKGTMAKPFINAVFGIFLALMIFGFIYSVVWGFDCVYDENDNYSEKYSQDLDSSVKYANLRLDSGAGYFTINDTTYNLIDAKSYGMFSDYDFNYDVIDSTGNLDIQLQSHDIKLFRNKLKNHLDMKLSTKPIWDFEFNVGASKNRFDLSNYKVRDLVIKTGATSTKVKLGDKYENTNVDIEMGAASLTLDIPQNVGCRIETDLALVAKNFQDFNKMGDGIYQTSNYDGNKKQMTITIKGGVSSFNVYRY